MVSGKKKISRALITVSDKTGILKFASLLVDYGIQLLSTAGTFKLISDAGMPVIDVSDYTELPEMMDGRVKTLHPRIHGGILGRRGTDDEVMTKFGITPIDMVVVNLYPFSQAVETDHCSIDHAIENIDIGGPALIRAAAKNHNDVAVVVDVSDYEEITEELTQNNGHLSYQTRYSLMTKAFAHTTAYDGMISNHFAERDFNNEKIPFKSTFSFQYKIRQGLRYGENPHQAAAFYIAEDANESSISAARQIQGKQLSFNNIADTDTALECVKQFAEPACVIVKHANPCGVAIADSLYNAYKAAHSTDPESAYGGIIAFNKELDEITAQSIIGNQFLEVLIAPSITSEALKVLKNKANIRCLHFAEAKQAPKIAYDYKKVGGGLLVQDYDSHVLSVKDISVVTERAPTATQIQDMIFTWKVVKMVKSNAIVFAKNGRTLGIGAGQMSRVNSSRIALTKAEQAGLEVSGAVMASDAFFPFRDGIDNAANAGVSCIIQPGGSKRDDEVISAANEHNIAMVFTAIRHFRH
ncbi:MAG: bifunctional phosphoribosylaminoimidazolecarboxamide formyltransferase/inosine monophosphate cyclohydrolase [Porticoccaceae bacterium]|nr:bifunctional phosphoribosylaminoimidazolecarboxamide formyltransferase/inosine monophosphate cyclohydrolase [Porticoccaceae bacterium]|tara:strand:- start:1046 stop:2623 length:1578 start_codon:yes stop_codon:yes gene_type:complete